jgi:hypothetical protein
MDWVRVPMKLRLAILRNFERRRLKRIEAATLRGELQVPHPSQIPNIASLANTRTTTIDPTPH